MQLINTSAQTQVVAAVDGSVTTLTGPRIGNPSFAGSVLSNELTVTVPTTNTTSGSGVSSATLCCGYTAPYTQSSVVGSSPGGNDDGKWTSAIPPQGAFTLDVDISPGV